MGRAARPPDRTGCVVSVAGRRAAIRPSVSPPPSSEPDVRVRAHPVLHEHNDVERRFRRAPHGADRGTPDRLGRCAGSARPQDRASPRSTVSKSVSGPTLTPWRRLTVRSDQCSSALTKRPLSAPLGCWHRRARRRPAVSTCVGRERPGSCCDARANPAGPKSPRNATGSRTGGPVGRCRGKGTGAPTSLRRQSSSARRHR